MKKLLFAALIAAAGVWAGIAQASTATSDITDMWWNPDESGWGVNVIQQNDIAFVTFFVYDTQGIPMWYTSAIQYQGVDANGSLIWTGALVATTGPWFGGPFPPTNVTRRTAGTVTFTLIDLDDAILNYSVDGVVVSKAIQRETWTNENYTGSYLGGFSITNSGCSPSNLNGVEELGGALAVGQDGPDVTISAVSSISSCFFNGTYSQAGKYGAMQGSYTCSDGTNGSFTASEMTPTIDGFTAHVVGHSQFCQWSGSFGGIVRAQ